MKAFLLNHGAGKNVVNSGYVLQLTSCITVVLVVVFLFSMCSGWSFSSWQFHFHHLEGKPVSPVWCKMGLCTIECLKTMLVKGTTMEWITNKLKCPTNSKGYYFIIITILSLFYPLFHRRENCCSLITVPVVVDRRQHHTLCCKSHLHQLVSTHDLKKKLLLLELHEYQNMKVVHN